MARPLLTPDQKTLVDSETPVAKYCRVMPNGRWEYGNCKRVKLKMEYEPLGMCDTQREAEDANGMGQPLPPRRHTMNAYTQAKHYYGGR